MKMFGKKKKQIEKLEALNKKLEKMLNDEKDRVDAHKEIAKVHTAYIAILLKKLGATSEETAFEILDEEVSQAIKKYETKGVANNKGAWKLFCAEKG